MSTPSPSTKKDKKADKQNDLTQDLFDYMSENTRAPVTSISEKDIRLSHEYRDRMMSDADAVNFAKEDGIDVNDIFYMSRRERLISEEIYLCNFENAGKPQTYVYDDEEWQNGISILQENGHLW
ncbi:hypothetical protein RhiirC2_801408 [Rhizophagus irregularis]|uniref:Uncharacterized protein n=1 Tax=Rhizophagus irregularis TaxID=588596 RepID=A0A2N1M2M8_9GLOM|nr:hypothetical protein RhiirC2_801408 [Rhizophagus irregularis]